MFTVCPSVNAPAVTPVTVAVAVAAVLVDLVMLPAAIRTVTGVNEALMVPVAGVDGVVAIG